MTDPSNLVEATRAVADPSTSAADLAAIAQAQPGLRAQVAAHPNAYPGLLDWLNTHGDATVKAAVAARQNTTGIPPVAPVRQTATPAPAMQAPQPPRVPWYSTRKGTKALIGAASGVVVVVVAVVLVVALVIAPNQRAAQAAASASAASASASAQAAQDYQQAVAAFNSAAAACPSANQHLASAIITAQSTAKTDPSTMQDPTLIDKLNQAITAAQGVKACAAPVMASDTARIQQQTTQLGTDTQAVTTKTSSLLSANQSVLASIQAKQQAAAQGEASASAGTGQTTRILLTATDGSGHREEWTISTSSFIKGSDSASLNAAWRAVGEQGTFPLPDGFQGGEHGSPFTVRSATGAFLIGMFSYQNLSTQYPASYFGGGGFNIYLDLRMPAGSQHSTHSGDGDGSCWYWSDGSDCYIQLTPENGFVPPASPQGAEVPFVYYVDSVFTPTHPEGDPVSGSQIQVVLSKADANDGGTIVDTYGNTLDQSTVTSGSIPVNW